MTRAAAIRAFVKANGPCLIGAIADAFKAKGRKERMRLYWAVAVMCRDGTLKKRGKARSLKYSYVREPVVQPRYTREELAVRRKDQEAARRRRDGIRTREQFLAEVRKEAAQRKAERADRPRAPKPKAPKPAKVVAAKRPTPKNIVIQPKAPSVIQVAPPKPRFETSDEWMARTGRTPEALPAPLFVKPWEPLPKTRKKVA